MSLLGNIIWLIFGGFFTGLGYIIGGGLLCLTIIGIPFGVQSIKLGIANFTPFGRELVTLPHGDSPLRIVFNLIWLIALLHLFHALILTLTVVGIPFAVQHLKLLPMAAFPFGRDLR